MKEKKYFWVQEITKDSEGHREIEKEKRFIKRKNAEICLKKWKDKNVLCMFEYFFYVGDSDGEFIEEVKK